MCFCCFRKIYSQKKLFESLFELDKIPSDLDDIDNQVGVQVFIKRVKKLNPQSAVFVQGIQFINSNLHGELANSARRAIKQMAIDTGLTTEEERIFNIIPEIQSKIAKFLVDYSNVIPKEPFQTEKLFCIFVCEYLFQIPNLKEALEERFSERKKKEVAFDFLMDEGREKRLTDFVATIRRTPPLTKKQKACIELEKLSNGLVHIHTDEKAEFENLFRLDLIGQEFKKNAENAIDCQVNIYLALQQIQNKRNYLVSLLGYQFIISQLNSNPDAFDTLYKYVEDLKRREENVGPNEPIFNETQKLGTCKNSLEKMSRIVGQITKETVTSESPNRRTLLLPIEAYHNPFVTFKEFSVFVYEKLMMDAFLAGIVMDALNEKQKRFFKEAGKIKPKSSTQVYYFY